MCCDIPGIGEVWSLRVGPALRWSVDLSPGDLFVQLSPQYGLDRVTQVGSIAGTRAYLEHHAFFALGAGIAAKPNGWLYFGVRADGFAGTGGAGAVVGIYTSIGR
jgi:hypothetical protein